MPLDASSPDPYAWLEEVDGPAALDWVAARNRVTTTDVASTSRFRETERAVREVLDSDDKIPGVSKIGDLYYNFWRDAAHPRGLWRRTTLDSYRTEHPDWETVLDLDALSEAEGTSWVWHGASILRPDCARALVALSPGGSDADVTREFDLVDLRFVPADEGGFVREQAKGSLGWIDEDHVFAATDRGPGTTTTSGYPRTVVRWTRGTPFAEAELVYAGDEDDLSVGAGHSRTPGFERDVVHRARTFYTSETYLLRDGDLTMIDVPPSAEVGFHREWLVIDLREDWTVGGRTFPAGSLLDVDLETFLDGGRELTALFTPGPTTSLAGATWTRHHLVLTTLDDVKDRLEVLTPPPPDAAAGTPWTRAPFDALPALGTVSARAVDREESDDVWLVTTDFLTPSTLATAAVGPGGASAPEPLKQSPAYFETDGLLSEQHFATSDDGTRVPYFVVRPRDLVLDGTAPTLLSGYGGFEISQLPAYSGTVGRAWLSRGGVHVVANIRGGGEYGPGWHQAALRENRHRAFDDFAAVARDLAARRITSAPHLGARGGSNGGLLVGNMLTRHPDLFGALAIAVPLLDMKRYSHLLAGASWIAEYGDPDVPADWEFLQDFSPYHRFDRDRTYPPVLFTTSTKDDRVHPAHARKMAAMMLDAGKDVTYYENVEGGHGGAADNSQAAFMAAVQYEYLWDHLAATDD
ncbi:prolyl oligopeptidase [Paraoerskovia marina]|uniref:Prolyl oligopeptidase n=1 Tax=Paraoerskovia marina TaxID=545619 RepID=A0A1H1R9Q4_9CELL|nr:prolyl oligopeptidase family serine peptidase [Paraoerskovia marina]SDS32410.1 prolyl oligopeptidase [Paraoerskovia marina]